MQSIKSCNNYSPFIEYIFMIKIKGD